MCKCVSPNASFPTTTPQMFWGILSLFSRKPRNNKSCFINHFASSLFDTASLPVREQVHTGTSRT